MILFVCETNTQLMNAINIRVNILKESKADICKEFSGDVYLKVYNALC